MKVNKYNLFAKAKKGTTSQQQDFTKSSSTLPLIDSCDKLKLDLFIEITLTGNTELLGEGEHVEAWEKIRTEYAELIGDISYKLMLSLFKEIQYINNKLHVIQTIVDHMQNYYHEDFKKILDIYGFVYNWDVSNKTVYDKQLKMIVSRSKTFLVQLESKRKEWEQLSKKNNGEQITRTYFEDVLLMLSKEQGYHLRANEISVYQFARLINLAKKHDGKRASK